MKEKVIEFFKADRYASLTGISIDEVEKRKSICSINLQDQHLNAKDTVHGGVIFTLADLAFGTAANAEHIAAGVSDRTVTMSAEIKYFSPGDGEKLTALASFISSEDRISIYEVKIKNDRDELIAEAKIKGFTKK